MSTIALCVGVLVGNIVAEFFKPDRNFKRGLGIGLIAGIIAGLGMMAFHALGFGNG